MTTDIRREIIGKQQTREFRIDPENVDEERRTVELAFSSEEPVERYWGREILDHSAGSVRMDRIRDGAPLLLNHQDQVGVVESARIDADRKGRSLVRFSRSTQGDEIFQDVQDGIRSKVSVGYVVHEMRLEESGDDGDLYRVTDWEPLEASIVSIPADATVGVGRSFQPRDENAAMPDPIKDEKPEKLEENREAAPVAPAPEKRDETPPADNSEAAEAAQIRSIGKHFGLEAQAEDRIMLGDNVEQFRAFVRKQRPDPIPTAPRIESRIPRAGNLRAFRPDLYDGGRREAEEAAYRAGQWCQAVMFSNQDSLRWCRDHQVQLAVGRPDGGNTRALTGLAAGQSAVVPDELVLPIISLREEYGLARRMCYVHPMTSDTASVPRDSGDVTAYFVGRESAATQSDPTLDNVNLTAKNVAAETRISNDYADDSAINLADHVADKHARAFAVKEDACLFNGDGTSTYGGIVGLRTAILGLAGAVDGASGHDTFAEVDAADLRNVMAALPDYPGIDPSWFTSKPGKNLVFGRLTDAAGGNTKRELGAMMPEQWGGYAIETSPAMPTVATDLSDVAMLLYGDLRMGVIFGDRRGITLIVDPYSLSSYQQTKIINSERFDINCHGVGDASDAGPVVALIGE